MKDGGKGGKGGERKRGGEGEKKKTYPLGVHLPLRLAHRLATLHHHSRHAIHGIIRLDLRDRQLGHVGGLVHLLGDGLFRKQDLGLLLGLRHGRLVALFDQVGNLLAHLAVGLLSFGGLAPRLLGREAGLELGLHVARELALGHVGLAGWLAGGCRLWEGGRGEGGVCWCFGRGDLFETKVFRSEEKRRWGDGWCSSLG